MITREFLDPLCSPRAGVVGYKKYYFQDTFACMAQKNRKSDREKK